MSERYSRLFSLDEQLYTEGSPIVIMAGALLKDSQTGHVLAQLKFKNISTKTITAVKICIRAFDITGTELKGVDEFQYLDLCETRDEEFGQKKAVPLPNNVTRSFTCECTGVIFQDGSIWERNSNEQKQLAHPATLFDRLGILAAQYVRDTTEHAKFVVSDDRDLWICTCGTINHADETTCHHCLSKKEALLSALDITTLESHNNDFKKAEAEKQAEREKKLAKVKKKAMIAGAIVSIVIVITLIITEVLVPFIKQKQEERALKNTYQESLSYMENGNYDAAIAGFQSISGYLDADAQLETCFALQEEAEMQALYDEAAQLVAQGDHYSASLIYRSITGFKDSADLYMESLYNHANQLVESNEFKEAIDIFQELNGYQDSTLRISEVQELHVQYIYELLETGRVGAAEAEYNDLIDYAVKPLAAEVSAEDFIVDEPYAFEGYTDLTEALQKLPAVFGWYYYDPAVDASQESVVITARDIQIGDHKVEVLLSYGQGKEGELSTTSYFYKEITPSLQSLVNAECKTYLSYEFEDYGLYFYFDNDDKVSFIAFSYDKNITAGGASGYGAYGSR